MSYDQLNRASFRCTLVAVLLVCLIAVVRVHPIWFFVPAVLLGASAAFQWVWWRKAYRAFGAVEDLRKELKR